jgi:hypothetical protein
VNVSAKKKGRCEKGGKACTKEGGGGRVSVKERVIEKVSRPFTSLLKVFSMDVRQEDDQNSGTTTKNCHRG